MSPEPIPSTPPEELSSAYARAARRFERLAARGWRLHFRRHPDAPGVSAAVQDDQGNTLYALTPEQVLDVAEGVRLEELRADSTTSDFVRNRSGESPPA